MVKNKTNIFQTVLFGILIFSLSGCGGNLPFSLSKPTDTSTPTNTPKPTATLAPTNTPLPSPTFTETTIPTPTITLLPTVTPAPTVPTPTPDAKNAILLYYINKNERGTYGCNEALWYINTGLARTTNTTADVTYAIRRIISYHGETIGILYNAGYASSLAIGEVIVEPEGPVYIYLTGTWTRTKDPCDGPRFRDMLKATARQFPTTKKKDVKIYINGITIGDVISRK